MATIAHSAAMARPHTLAASTPWYAWCAVLALFSAVIGGHWDIAWHMSIGRDTFWTPAHMAIYLCGILGGVVSAYLIFGTMLGYLPDLAPATVRVLGFRGPLGAFVMGWGGTAMLTSAPFDNWWHDAYGLDVKILSPPHVVLMVGTFSIGLGALFLLLGLRNRAQAGEQVRYDRLLLVTTGLLLTMILVALLEYSGLYYQHTAMSYLVLCTAVPFYFWIAAETSSNRWACTYVAGVYTVILLAMLWILPRFPAEPKLGPVYHPLTHFVPAAGFPLLLIVPALVLDLARPKLHGWGTWRKAAVLGPLFVVAFLAVQWPFATFLQSPLARNAVFGSGYYGYYVGPVSYTALHRFYVAEPTWTLFAMRIFFAMVGATVMTGFGLSRGAWMRKVQR